MDLGGGRRVGARAAASRREVGSRALALMDETRCSDLRESVGRFKERGTACSPLQGVAGRSVEGRAFLALAEGFPGVGSVNLVDVYQETRRPRVRVPRE